MEENKMKIYYQHSKTNEVKIRAQEENKKEERN